MTEKEEWRKIRGYSGYLVSDKGRVFSMKFARLMKPHKRDSPGGKTSRPRLTAVCLTRDGKKHTMYVHRLVADTFICELTHADAVTHFNGDRTDNRVENLVVNGYSPHYKKMITVPSAKRAKAHHELIEQIMRNGRAIMPFDAIK